MLFAANVFIILKIDYCLGENAAFSKKIRFGGWGIGNAIGGAIKGAIKANTDMLGLSDGKVTSKLSDMKATSMLGLSDGKVTSRYALSTADEDKILRCLIQVRFLLSLSSAQTCLVLRCLGV